MAGAQNTPESDSPPNGTSPALAGDIMSVGKYLSFAILLLTSCLSSSSPVVARAPLSTVVEGKRPAKPTTNLNAAPAPLQASQSVELPAVEQPSKPTPIVARKLRRLRDHEASTALIVKARELIGKHCNQRIGTEIPVELEGRQYVARLEVHYHPEGGAVKPWGYHRGISMFVVEARDARAQ